MPITPSSSSKSIKNQNKTYVLLDGTEINNILPKGLTSWSITFEIPSYFRSYAQYVEEFLPPSYYINAIEEINKAEKPIYLTIVRPESISEDILCTVETVEVTESAQNVGDFSLKIGFKRYIDYGTKNYAIESTESLIVKGNENKDDEDSEDNIQYKVIDGDTIESILNHLYSIITFPYSLMVSSQDIEKTDNWTDDIDATYVATLFLTSISPFLPKPSLKHSSTNTYTFYGYDGSKLVYTFVEDNAKYTLIADKGFGNDANGTTEDGAITFYKYFPLIYAICKTNGYSDISAMKVGDVLKINYPDMITYAKEYCANNS